MNNKLTATLICAVMALMLLTPVGVTAATESSQYCGIDVSLWQGEINFDKVKDSGIKAVYIRAGEGANIVDRYFERNYEQAKEAGLRYGFYHYVTARSEEEALEQADFFASLIGSRPYHMRAAMDFENLSGLSPKEAVAIAKAYLERLDERLGHTPAVYSDAYDAASIWKANLVKYPLWVADYGVSRPYSTGGWETWSGFQYNDKGLVKGIKGHVDLDYFRSEIFLTNDEQDKAKKIRLKHSKANDSCDSSKSEPENQPDHQRCP